MIISFMTTSCVNDLDTIPIDEDVVTAGVVFDDPKAYKQVLAKLYAGLSVTGQQGPAGQPDIEGIDEGFGQYVRMYWYHQVLTTEEAVIGWNDQTIKDFHDQTWGASDGFIFALYSRLFYQVAICNEFLRETTEAKLNDRGVDASLKEEIKGYRAEARFLRALSYWHALDLFRNVPFVTEDDIVGAFFPPQISGPELFNYLESELLDIENTIAPVRSNEYGRADQGAVWTLLAKLYQNAEVYTGTARNADCLSYCEKVINAGYTLDEDYRHLFLADNHLSDEVIFPVTYDGINTRTWGGTTFIIRAGIGGSMDPDDSGVASGWGGTRTTKELVAKFPADAAGGVVVAANQGNTLTYPLIYVPGKYQGWDPTDRAAGLASVNSNRVHVGYKYFPEDNSPFLFTRVPSFGLTLGDNGGDGTLEMNGDTMYTQEAGLYHFEVDLNTNTYTMERREWGLIGDGAGVGWDNDLDMTWNADEQAMEVFVNLVEGGEIKFRANDNWDVNLGDNAGDAILTQEGANIVVTKGGEYQVLLYLDRPDYTYELRLTSFDNRGAFWSDGQNLEINDLSLFTEGYAINKFKNVSRDGLAGSDQDHPDTDFPMFRLADVLLMASEAILRDNGNRAQALDYFNRVRFRAYGGSSAGYITDAELDLDMILDERARELYWEAHRRTDLVRHGKFSDTNYTWAWKGGVMEGKSTEAYRDVFPLPSSDIGANPNLSQNEGY